MAPHRVTGGDMVAAMDVVGVDGAQLVSPFTIHRYEPSYALLVKAAHPGRFGLITPVDPADPAVADTVAAWAGDQRSWERLIASAKDASRTRDLP